MKLKANIGVISILASVTISIVLGVVDIKNKKSGKYRMNPIDMNLLSDQIVMKTEKAKSVKKIPKEINKTN